jgi:hypothetical protein
MRGVMYNTGLLVGRAFSHASQTEDGTPPDRGTATAELCELAAGDRLALVMAQARFEEFLARPGASPADARALALLDDALERFDTLCAA